MRPYGLSFHALAVHPQMREDELLSSWIARLAWANHIKIHSLVVRMGGNGATVWNRDIDRLVPRWLLLELEKLTGISASRARRAGLTELASKLVGGAANTQGTEAWLLPLGIWHRKRVRFGVQYCPICLHAPQGQYIRRAWRLSFCTECEIHRVMFWDRCHVCGAPVSYFRQDMDDRRPPDKTPSMAECAACGAALYQAPASRFAWPSRDLQLAVWTLVFAKDFGCAYLQDRVFEDASSLFRVLRQVIRIMSSHRQDGQLYDAVADQLWPEGYQVLGSRGLQFERRGVDERHRLFAMATWLLMDWPERFREVLAQSGIGKWCLIQDMRDPPEWYAQEYQRLIGRSV